MHNPMGAARLIKRSHRSRSLFYRCCCAAATSLGVVLVLQSGVSALGSHAPPSRGLNVSVPAQRHTRVAKKQQDSSKRYRWLFREPRRESGTTGPHGATLLERLDRETKRARKLYLSGETDNAILKYRSAIDRLESLVDDIPPGDPLLQEVEQRLLIYDELASKILGPIYVEPKEEIAGRIFHLMEKRRMCRRNLILKKAGNLEFFDVSGKLVREESAILGKLFALRREVSSPSSREAEEGLKSKLAQIRMALQKSSQRYAMLRRGLPMSLDEVRRDLLGPNEMILDFNFLPDRLAVGFITREKGIYYQVPANRAEIDRAVFNLQDKLREFSFGRSSTFMGHAWKEPCRRIYRTLLGKLPAIPRDRSTVFVIPDRSLWYLPLSVLLDAEDRPFGVDRCVTLIPSVDMLKFTRSEAGHFSQSGSRADLVVFESIPWISEKEIRDSSGDRKAKDTMSEGEKIEQLILTNPVYPKPSEIIGPVQKIFKRFEVWTGPTATVDHLLEDGGRSQGVTVLAVPLAVTDSVRRERRPCFFFSPDKKGRRRLSGNRLFAVPLRSRLMVLPIAWFDVRDRESAAGEGPLLLHTAMLYSGARMGMINYSDPNWGSDEPFLLAVLKKAAASVPLAKAFADYPRELPAGLDASFSGRPPAWTGWIFMGDPGR